MKKLFSVVSSAILAAFFSPVSAELIDRGDGFIYDDVLDITWTQNANINGPTNWDAQLAWADGYSQTHSLYGTFDNWRLPSVDVNGDNSIVNCATASAADCQDNEYGYLYYQYGISDAAPGLFTNVASAYYWSGTPSTFNPPCCAWIFGLFDGFQSGNSNKGLPRAAWAVMDGDIAALVPSTAYTVNVNEVTSAGSITGYYSATGDGLLIGSNMSFTYRGEYRFPNFIDDVAILSRTGTFDLVAQTGSAFNHDCVYVSGINNLCEILTLDVEGPLPVVSVSATSGSPIVVVWDDSQTESTNTFTVVAPVAVNIDIVPGDPGNTVHPHHDGSPSAVAGLNDVIPVAVLSSSIALGDPVDFDATTIDASSVRFGPGEGGVAAGSTPDFSADQDGDGLNDAYLEFLTGDTGVGCAATEMTLTGNTGTGDAFAGTDTVNADCDALCHN